MVYAPDEVDLSIDTVLDGAKVASITVQTREVFLAVRRFLFCLIAYEKTHFVLFISQVAPEGDWPCESTEGKFLFKVDRATGWLLRLQDKSNHLNGNRYMF